MGRETPHPTPEEEVEAHKLYRRGLKIPSICAHFSNRFSIDTMSRLVVPGYREKRAEQARIRRATKPAPSEAARKARAEQSNLAYRIKEKARAEPPKSKPLSAPPTAPESLNLPYSELPPGGCTFAVNDGAVRDLLFCGVPVRRGKSYCAYHGRVASGGLPVRKRTAAGG